MEKIVIEGSNDCPKIILDGELGQVFIGGSSLPENVLEVYNPVLIWIDEYAKNPRPVTNFDFFYDYLNTASSHMIMRIFEKIKQLAIACPKININWHYPKSDHDMRDFGEELQELINIPIKLVVEENFP